MSDPAGGGPRPDPPVQRDRRPGGDERRTAEAGSLVQRTAWLRGLADHIAVAEPVLEEIRHRLASVETSTPLTALLDEAWRGVARARADVEVLATALEHLATTHARGGDLATSSLFARPGSPRLADGSPTADDVRALVLAVSADLPPRLAARLRRRIGRASRSELTVLGDVAAAGLTHDQLIRLLEGGHLLLPGNALRDRWSRLDGARPRTSSHYHPRYAPTGRGPAWVERLRARARDAHARPEYGQQYGLKGAFVHEALFGPGPHDTTFLQLERAAPSKLRLVEHIGDWIEYRFTRRNQGPYGSSVDTDAHPIVAPDRPVDLHTIADGVERLESIVVEVAGDLEALGPMGDVVWRGPASGAFDDAVRRAAIDLGRAATSLGSLRRALDAEV